ncbi:MAG: transporter [Halioglobus sp.]
MKQFAFRLLTILVSWSSAIAWTEEGGGGHYFPGSMSSFIDGVPAGETTILRLNVLNYSGNFDSNVAVPIAGLAALDVNVDSTAVGLTALWRPPLDIAESWSYAAAITVPFVDLDVAADVLIPQDPLQRTVRRGDSDSGLGDTLLFPVMLNYNASPALNYNFRLGLYAPTGGYEQGRLANTGKNYWSVEPTIAAVYLSPESGREFSAFFGTTFNEENSDTNYESGTQAHLELTAAQHFPLWGGLAGVGATAYWYQQITGDSGRGANFGDFKGRALGLGPVVSYTSTIGGADLVAEFKWVHESHVKRRPEGDTLFLKVVAKF